MPEASTVGIQKTVDITCSYHVQNTGQILSENIYVCVCVSEGVYLKPAGNPSWCATQIPPGISLSMEVLKKLKTVRKYML